MLPTGRGRKARLFPLFFASKEISMKLVRQALGLSVMAAALAALPAMAQQSGMSGMSGMSGQKGMSGMSGQQGMSGMSGMSGNKPAAGEQNPAWVACRA